MMCVKSVVSISECDEEEIERETMEWKYHKISTSIKNFSIYTQIIFTWW